MENYRLESVRSFSASACPAGGLAGGGGKRTHGRPAGLVEISFSWVEEAGCTDFGRWQRAAFAGVIAGGGGMGQGESGGGGRDDESKGGRPVSCSDADPLAGSVQSSDHPGTPWPGYESGQQNNRGVCAQHPAPGCHWLRGCGHGRLDSWDPEGLGDWKSRRIRGLGRLGKGRAAGRGGGEVEAARGLCLG